MATLDREALQILATTRLDDAKTLLSNARYAAAFYLAGYAIECALKASIARQTRKHAFPDKNRVIQSYTHDLEKLKELSGLPIDAALSVDAILAVNWSVVAKWEERSRYRLPTKKEAEDLIEAIDDPKHGVLPWLQEHW